MLEWREAKTSCTGAASAVLARNRQAVHRSGRSVAADEAVCIDALVLFLTGRSHSRRIGSDYAPISHQISLLLFLYSCVIHFFPASNHFLSGSLL